MTERPTRRSQFQPIRRLAEAYLGEGADRAEAASLRRLAAALARQPDVARLGFDPRRPGALRKREDDLVLLVPGASQAARLRQLRPRLGAALREAGWNGGLVIRVIPPTLAPSLRPRPPGTPRRLSPEAAAALRERAAGIQDEELRRALLALADTAA